MAAYFLSQVLLTSFLPIVNGNVFRNVAVFAEDDYWYALGIIKELLIYKITNFGC